MTTVDRKGRPYSIIIHPLWEGSTGWIWTFVDSHKAKHLTRRSDVSLSYIRGDVQKPVYVDGLATWVADASTRRRVWELVKSTPEPVGFDPALDFRTFDAPRTGLLRIDPRRIAVVTFPAESDADGTLVWRSGN